MKKNKRFESDITDRNSLKKNDKISPKFPRQKNKRKMKINKDVESVRRYTKADNNLKRNIMC